MAVPIDDYGLLKKQRSSEKLVLVCEEEKSVGKMEKSPGWLFICQVIKVTVSLLFLYSLQHKVQVKVRRLKIPKCSKTLPNIAGQIETEQWDYTSWLAQEFSRKTLWSRLAFSVSLPTYGSKTGVDKFGEAEIYLNNIEEIEDHQSAAQFLRR